MQKLLPILHILRRHWAKVAVALVVVFAGSTFTVSASVRENAHTAWHAVLSWAGIGGESADSGKVFWCPMHPQIKSKKENAVCPICNMALVELEGGLVDAPLHLTLTAQQIQQAGVVTAPVIRRKLYREIDTTGRIDYDERRLTKITSWISGKSRIEKLHVNYKGIHVKKGEPLAELYSPNLIVAQHEYLTALRTLSRSSTSGLGDRLLKSARQKLKHQGLTDSQIDKLTTSKQPQDRIPIVAPASGTVHKSNVQEGQYVAEGDVLFELVDLSHLWVFADIFEEELPLVRLGLPVEVSVQSLPDKTLHGAIGFIDHMVKPGTRTVPIRVDVPNENHVLKAGMFARVQLQHRWPSALAVPENAVLWSGRRAVVIVQHGEGKFQPHQVKLGRKWLYAADASEAASKSLGFGDGAMRYHEVLAGLAPGDNVVTAGAFLLNAESQFQNVLAKMLPPALQQRVTLEEALGESVARDIRDVLTVYFDLVAALAKDELDGVPKQIEALSRTVESLRVSAKKSNWEKLSTDAALLGTALAKYKSEPATDDLSHARRQFGDISHKLATLLSHHGGNYLLGKEVFFFHCGMAKVGYERWLWRTPQLYNPYMGKKMLTCGKKLDVLEP